ncbi:MAG: hypothetical protein OHK0057_08530 [Thermoflexibacter sp.]
MSDRLGDKVRLQHIADAIIEIRNYTQGVSFEDFVSNSMMKNACIRQLEVIGEASSRISDELKKRVYRSGMATNYWLEKSFNT